MSRLQRAPSWYSFQMRQKDQALPTFSLQVRPFVLFLLHFPPFWPSGHHAEGGGPRKSFCQATNAASAALRQAGPLLCRGRDLSPNAAAGGLRSEEPVEAGGDPTAPESFRSLQSASMRVASSGSLACFPLSPFCPFCLVADQPKRCPIPFHFFWPGKSQVIKAQAQIFPLKNFRQGLAQIRQQVLEGAEAPEAPAARPLGIGAEVG